MTDPYTRASELKDFAFCHRAWFLERRGIETTLTEARDFGTADHAHRATAVRRGQTLHRASGLVLTLAAIAATLIALAWLTHR